MTGTAQHGNQACEAVIVRFGSSQNRIQGNLIADSASDGLAIRGGNNNTVRGNFIGTNVTGLVTMPNRGAGVRLNGKNAETQHNLIGGGSPEEGNVISGNREQGIVIEGRLASWNRVENNYIGLTANGTEALPNLHHGVWIVNSSHNTIGGTEPGQGNTIAFNGRTGVRVQSLFDDPTTGNAILGNWIHSNGALGIDLGIDAGVTKNDPFDEDTGANTLQNFPELTPVIRRDGVIHIGGRLRSAPNTTYRPELFKN